jgi:putative transposase
MNPPKCSELDYINFLIAAQKVFSSVEASNTHPASENVPAHDAYTRLLQRLPPDSLALWQEVQECIEPKGGILIIDDSTLDKPYASKMALVTQHWSGKHGRVVKGINLISLVWSRGSRCLPCDFRIYHKTQDGLSKNDHFQQMIQTAKGRGFNPELVAFDSWYASLDNLKLVRHNEWDWLTQLASNRQESIDRSGNRAIRETLIPAEGRAVHLKGYGWIKVFKTIGTNGDFEYWATSKLDMSLQEAAFYALDAWQVEVYHRGLKQFTGIERAQFRLDVSQRNHIGLAIRAFVRLEVHRLRTGASWYETKTSIIRSAIRAYLACPTITLGSTA